MRVLSLTQIILKGCFESVKEKIEHGADINACDDDGNTPLFVCALTAMERHGVGIARMLVEHGANTSLTNKNGLNALHCACLQNKPELVNFLLLTVDVDINKRCRMFGNTALHYAVISGNLDIVSAVINRAMRYRKSINVKNKEGSSPIELAFELHNMDTCRLLAMHGASTTPLIAISIATKENKVSSSDSSKQGLVYQQSRRQALTVDQESLVKRRKMLKKSLDSDQHHSAFSAASTSLGSERVKKDSWREELANIWSKYSQQCSATYRRSAKPVTIEHTLPEDRSETENPTSIPVRRRQSSLPGFSRMRRGSIQVHNPAGLKLLAPPTTGFEAIRRRRQSLAV